MSLHKFALLAIVPAIAACAASDTSRTVPAVCDLGEYQQYVGKNIGDLKLPRNSAVRVISPGMAITMDYSASRANIYVDDKGWIGKVSCG